LKDTEMQMSKAALLAEDPEVLSGRSVTEREAKATLKLQPLLEEIFELEHALNRIDQVLVVVKSKKGDLKDIQGRIREQWKICQEERENGGRWGSDDDKEPLSTFDPLNNNNVDDSVNLTDVLTSISMEEKNPPKKEEIEDFLSQDFDLSKEDDLDRLLDTFES
ncbi:MAG: hypothetical protein AAGM67_02360, partial [Bacteroidota bacterium]